MLKLTKIKKKTKICVSKWNLILKCCVTESKKHKKRQKVHSKLLHEV